MLCTIKVRFINSDDITRCELTYTHGGRLTIGRVFTVFCVVILRLVDRYHLACFSLADFYHGWLGIAATCRQCARHAAGSVQRDAQQS